ncbi:MAG: hypothetical protein DHS20C17_16990 [Cyclobacteriaceae bacterium]|nr:MAG: hypothetical protein DHS20C17_16990 [Cyclobacteriaceae bacterium]
MKYNNPELVVDLGVGLWAWPLPMDFDDDGDIDLIVSCPDTPFNGLYFFENTSPDPGKQIVFEPPVKIGPGKRHLQISLVNDEPRVLGQGIEYKNFKESIFEQEVQLYPKDSLENQFTKIRFSQWKYVDYENDGDLDLIAGIDEWEDYGWDNAHDSVGNWINGPLHGYVFLLENIDGIHENRGKIMAGDSPLDVYGAPSPNMMDFDNDGDLDLICGEFIDRLTWFENIGSREHPVFSKGRFLLDEIGDTIRMDLEMIIPVAIDMDKDGDVDLIVGDEDGRVALIENTGLVSDNMPVFHQPQYLKQKADLVKFGSLATPFAVDWDEDGDQDLISGNAAGYIGFIENLDGENPPKWNKPVYLKSEGEVIRIQAGDKGSIQGPAEKKWGYTTLSVADWDGDDLPDIVVNSIWGKILWYKNIGTKGSPLLAKHQAIVVEHAGEAAKPPWNWWDPQDNHLVTQWRTTPYAIDWDRDGLMDLIMLDTEGYLSFYQRYVKDGALKLKPGARIFYGVNGAVFDNKNNVIDATTGPLRLNQGVAGKSGRRKLTITDWDQDDDYDLLVNSVNVSLFENVGTENGKVMFEHRGPLFDTKLAGHTTSPSMMTEQMILVGAEDGHFYHTVQSD